MLENKEKIILTEIGGKMAFKKGSNGYCYTFNKNKDSRRRAFENAKASVINSEYYK